MLCNEGAISKQTLLLKLIKSRSKKTSFNEGGSPAGEPTINPLLLKSVAGCNIAWYVDGKVNVQSFGGAHSNSNSSITKDHGFRSLCIMKVFVAYTILIYFDKNKIDLKITLNQIFSKFNKYEQENFGFFDVTVEDLLNHRLGIDETALYELIVDSNEDGSLIEKFKILHKVFSPGENFMYSSLSYILIALILEVLEETSWLAVIEDYLFKPLNINVLRYNGNDTLCAKGFSREKNLDEVIFSEFYGIDIPIDLEPAQSSRVRISCEDLLKLPVLIIKNGYTENGIKLLSKDSLERLSKVNVDIDYHHVISGWASGWFNFSDDIFGYITNGFGLHVLVAFDLKTKKALVIQSNTKDSISLLSDVYKDFFGKDLIRSETRAIEAEHLAGTYHSQACDLIFYKNNDQILVRAKLKDFHGNITKEGGEVAVVLGNSGSATALNSNYPFEGTINLFNCSDCNYPAYIRIKHTIYLKKHKCTEKE